MAHFLDRFQEAPDDHTARCEWCDCYIGDNNKCSSFKIWEKNVGIADPATPLTLVQSGVTWKRFALGSWWYREIDGCTTCHKEEAKESALRFLADGDLEDAMTELAEALGIPVGAAA